MREDIDDSPRIVQYAPHVCAHCWERAKVCILRSHSVLVPRRLDGSADLAFTWRAECDRRTVSMK